jgi:glycosyltransferase involved in cell wall biosynthesis
MHENEHEIVFVDDNSQDGTSESISVLSDLYPVKLHIRYNEKGLASAVI